MADMICHKVYELLMSILNIYIYIYIVIRRSRVQDPAAADSVIFLLALGMEIMKYMHTRYIYYIYILYILYIIYIYICYIII